MERSILNISAYRDKKQNQGEYNAKGLIRKVMEFTERNANIREKVRARNLFRNLIGLSEEQIFSPNQEKAFTEWFLYDYQTIQGLTMFSLFLRKYHQHLTEPELIQGALFLTSVFEPVQIEEIYPEKNELFVSEVFSGKQCLLFYEKADFSSISKGDLYFVRKISIIKRDLVIGNMYRVNDKSVLERLEREYDMTVKEDQPSSWMTFLKRTAIKFLFHT
ncbi:hypothetical protein ACFYKX_22785 [Cytobacillus sp. FJAT-54145]|uniref:Uncharacterized protein n=1 Tax=Cytobacillus spartinae TaxID=3299023 RepID=A0ABW6KGT2_9BACI